MCGEDQTLARTKGKKTGWAHPKGVLAAQNMQKKRQGESTLAMSTEGNRGYKESHVTWDPVVTQLESNCHHAA